MMNCRGLCFVLLAVAVRGGGSVKTRGSEITETARAYPGRVSEPKFERVDSPLVSDGSFPNHVSPEDRDLKVPVEGVGPNKEWYSAFEAPLQAMRELDRTPFPTIVFLLALISTFLVFVYADLSHKLHAKGLCPDKQRIVDEIAAKETADGFKSGIWLAILAEIGFLWNIFVFLLFRHPATVGRRPVRGYILIYLSAIAVMASVLGLVQISPPKVLGLALSGIFLFLSSLIARVFYIWWAMVEDIAKRKAKQNSLPPKTAK